MNYCKLIIVGRITRDVQLSYLPDQTPVVDIGIAWNKKVKGQDKASFLDCVAFGKNAENISKFFSKGKAILLEGELEFQMWEKDGVKHSKHKMIVFRWEFTDAPKEQATPPQQQLPLTEGGAPF